ncbi:Chaperone protein dnaJ 49 [Apostasia shenzhenica]|uniref:Chaperone protein dnaJ 49 n=1 Tax=Apostasia shenzhenica TaxID=1088818 RepID=A0A2I0ACH2_9ASPA|nr:Chaperone protein dnaJ 49 [Apostasia shenzhenica]
MAQKSDRSEQPSLPAQSAAEATERGELEKPDAEARRLKTLAEEKFKSSSLKSALNYARRARQLCPELEGISRMVTALKILRAFPTDHYKILRAEPFSHINVVKKQYKALALALHPDKATSPFPAAEDAFKRVADSFRLLSDRSRKREYDTSLRLALADSAAGTGSGLPVETFWTACMACRLLHEFDRRYIGYSLVCPNCRKSFLAIEVPSDSIGGGLEEVDTRNIARVTPKVTAARSRTRARPRVPTGWGTPERNRNSVYSSFNGLNKSKQRKEKTLAEILIELVGAKKKGKKKVERGSMESTVSVMKEVEDLSLMAVEDSDFYDFDNDRSEKCFAKGQIWAIYDDDDGMPRHYGLIDEVVSAMPFRVKMSWLDMQIDGDESLLLWEKSGHHVSFGRFKVGRKVEIDSVNLFSHLVECERAAKELYRVFPKKGSVWALYGDVVSGSEKRSYDIVVFLTSYSEMFGLSMGYLEKVEGYKTIFKRKQIGPHAVLWLEKDDVLLFSHQIPARKLTDNDTLNLPGECWELDPASLPADLLHIAK